MSTEAPPDSSSDSAPEAYLRERVPVIARAVAENRASWITVGLLPFAVGAVLQFFENGTLDANRAMAALMAVLLIRRGAKEWLTRTIAAQLVAEHRPAQLQDLYDRMMSVRIMHVGGRVVLWVVVLAGAFGGIVAPWLSAGDAGKTTATTTPVETVATALPAAASPGELQVSNRCARAVRVALRVRSDEWRTLGWYEFAANQTAYLEYDGRRVSLNHPALFLYGESTDSEVTWAGDPSNAAHPAYEVSGRLVTFRPITAAEQGGALVVELTCP